MGSLGLLSEDNKDSVEWESFEDAVKSDRRVHVSSDSNRNDERNVFGENIEDTWYDYGRSRLRSTSSNVFTANDDDDIDLTGLQDLSNDEDSYLRAALRVTAQECFTLRKRMR